MNFSHAMPVAPTAQAASTSAPLAQLKIPPSMPLLMQEDYPNIRFWNKEDWVKFEEKRNRGGNMAKNSKMDFLCDEDGNPLSDARHKQITEAGKSAYNSLYRYRMDPLSWTKGDDDAKQYVNNILETKFSEFRYCSHGWKVLAWNILRYPDWVAHSRKRGNLIRMFNLFYEFFFQSTMCLRCRTIKRKTTGSIRR
jgi:hypothetical protein